MNALKALHDEQDQAVWLDFVARGFIAKGELKQLVERDGLRGVTSNPSIFEKAIGHSDEYDDSLKAVQATGDSRVIDLYEGLAIADIQAAADVLRPVYEASDGADGYVSLEVSPYLALDTEETLAEARRLHKAVSRDNLMVKVPATPQGIPAIRQLTSEGISINVTLLFSQEAYEAVARAFIDGLDERAKAGHDVSRIASVASFFISRIDVLVDKLLDEKIAEANDPDEKIALEQLKGKVAIANAKLAYQRYKRIFAESKWTALAEKGAKAQRLLWASTGVKNKAYSDVLYVEELIGPNTVNTMPPATMDAFRDHGVVRATIEEDVPGAEAVMAKLARTGIDIETIAEQLVREGVQLFIDAADNLLGAVAGKRAALLGHRLDGQSLAMDDTLAAEEGCRVLARQRVDPPALGGRRLGLVRPRRGELARLAAHRRGGAGEGRRLRRLLRVGEGAGLHRRRRARHGRVEPRPGGPEPDLRPARGLPQAPDPRLDPPGSGARPRGEHRPGQDPVHRRLQVRLDAGAERLPRLLPGPRQGRARRPGRRPFRGRDRSRLRHGARRAER